MTPADQREAQPSWRDALLPATATLQEAITSLNKSGLQIALIVDDDDILVGTLTDGDIRRGLLRGINLKSPVSEIVQRNALLAPPEMSRELVRQLMDANKIHQLPVVDERRRVVGLHLWDALVSPIERPNRVILMAGGEGTRLYPHTKTCPKPMLPVGGKPMLEHIIAKCRAEGFTRLSIAVHYLGHMIEEYFGDGEKWHVKIDYIREERPLGTAGAISLLSEAPKEPFIVSNGDILTDIRFGELLDFHCRHRAAATMAVRAHEWQLPFGVVHTDGVDIVGFVEKPVALTHVNAGMYVLDPSALEVLSPGEACHMPALFERLQQQGKRTIAYPMHEPWLDVGRPSDYEEADAAKRGASARPRPRE